MDGINEITDLQKQQLKADIREVTQDSPQSLLAATRLKKALATLTGAVGNAIGRIVTEVATEAAKKLLLG